jgi:undecaprenyl diphosphate synthase
MSNVPKHITIIMDGNGRWAKQRGLERLFGHRAGKESVSQACEYAAEMGVEYLSLFAFSEENWNRPEAEVNGLMRLMAKAMVDEKPTLLKNGIRFRAIGDLSRLDASLVEDIRQTERDTAVGTRMTLLVFLSYSGKWDILQAAKKVAAKMLESPEEAEDIMSMGIEDFDGYLATAGIPDPDLIVRTSGECRLSNYLLWQGAYSELLFTDTLWPDFRKEDFRKALDYYAKRDRRYGKVK